MQKVFDFQAGAYVYVDDEQPTNILRPRVKRIKCLVCQRNEAESATARLCIHCGADLLATRTHVYLMAEATRDRLHQTGDTYKIALAAADETVLARFNNYLTSTDPAARAAAENAAQRGAIGPLADLIRLWLDYQQAQTAQREREAWVKQCEEAF